MTAAAPTTEAPARKRVAKVAAKKVKKAAKAKAVDTTGIYLNKSSGKHEITIFWGAYATVEEAAAARAYALQAKATYKAQKAD